MLKPAFIEWDYSFSNLSGELRFVSDENYGSSTPELAMLCYGNLFTDAALLLSRTPRPALFKCVYFNFNILFFSVRDW